MIEHFGLESLVTYQLEPVSETTRVVNPAARTLGAQIKSKAAQLSRRQAEYGAGELDTIKMVAYRAETALAMSLRQHLARTDDARALLREIFVAAAALCPDETAGTLTVNLHHLSNACSDRLAAQLAEELNATETIFPGTQLKMVFKLVSV
jgi:hypothetical protein